MTHAKAVPLPGQVDSQRQTQILNTIAVVVPFLALAIAIPLLWDTFVTWRDLGIFLFFYVISCAGISLGYHRLLSHRSYDTYPAIRALLAYCGAIAFQGPPITWAADHRLHHSCADEEGDPHSPHTHGGGGVWATLRGLAHAHVGWLLRPTYTSEPVRYAPDLIREPSMRFISRRYLAIVVSGLVLPGLMGYLLGGTWHAALTGFVWGGVVRVLVLHHVTWSVNSICHVFGTRRFETTDRSRNFWPLALVSMGEAWHHNHHTFPTSARHGLRWWELDISGLIISAAKRVGLAWDVVEISPERQRRKLSDPAQVAST
jgi:stearoyl-CoA desaturase (delta-9 desaturase)